MAIREILKGADNERLRKKSREVTTINKRIIDLVQDLKDTMKREDGVGLAAPQVGVLRRVIVGELDGSPTEIINPVISNTKGSEIENEGCLSLLPENGYVERPESLTVTGLNIKGEEIKMDLSGLNARIICHECDHLEGVLFVDKVIDESELDFIDDEEE